LGSGSSAAPSDQALVQLADAPDGLDMALSDGKRGPEPVDRAALPPARKLAEPDVNALFTRARPITADASDKQDFALRPKSLPPPRTGQTIKGSFPPPASTLLPPPTTNDAGKALSVLRYMPERSEERRVGKECRRLCRSRWSPYH
jgi:hypothetical protein